MTEIRPARESEVQAAHALEVLAYPAAEAASARRFEDRQRSFPAGFLLALENGRIRGLLCAVRTASADLSDDAIKAEGGDDPQGQDLVILSVATDPAHRGRGIAGLLLAAIALEAEAGGFRRLRLLCKEVLVPFYRRHGYRYVQPSTSRHGGVAWHEMERPPGLRGLRCSPGAGGTTDYSS